MSVLPIPRLRRESLLKGLPALVVALGAFAFAAYGKWVLPKQLPNAYQERLTEYEQRYHELDPDDSESLKLGSSIAICYDRLDRMGIESEPWERLEFYSKHLDRLKHQLATLQEDQSGADPAENQEDLEKQISDFSERERRLTESLASEDSDYALRANLRIARALLEEDFSPSRAKSLITALENLSRKSSETASSANLRLYQDLLRYELAWQAALSSGAMPPDFSTLSGVDLDHETLETDGSDEQADPEQSGPSGASIKSTEMALVLKPNAADKASKIIDEINATQNLKDRFEEFLLAQSATGEWASVRSLLSQRFAVADEEYQREIRVRLSSSFLRLFFSHLAKNDSKWISSSPAGLQLAMELNPAAVELNALLWELALEHAELRADHAVISEELVEAILISDSSQRYAILALSNALRGALDPAQNYLDFSVKQDPNSLARIGNIVLWQASILPSESEIPIERLTSLLKDNQDQDSSTYTSLALARLQIRSGELDDASSTLDQVEKITGETAILLALRKQVLDAIGAVESNSAESRD